MKTFKKLSVIGALALSALAPVAVMGETLVVHVPFSFVAAGQEFPAGDYRVQDDGSGTIVVQGSGRSVITLSIPSGVPKAGGAPGLQFAKENQKLYLIGVQGGDALHMIGGRGK